MAQGIFSFKYEEEKGQSGSTALAGLPLYLELFRALGLSRTIERHLKVRSDTQGWTDNEVITAGILLNLAGGECVDDMRKLEADEGFCRVLRKVQTLGLSRKQRQKIKKRWRKEREGAVPSPSSVFRYLLAFHDEEQEKLRVPGKAFIPEPNEYLQGLARINREIAGFLQTHSPEGTATLDMDATLIETNKADAHHCYKGYKSYQPLNVWWTEQDVVLHTEFRDGNVPAGYEQLRVFKEALAHVPEGVKRVRLRSDTAGYQHNLMRYCEMAESREFGRIEFAIGVDVTPEFKQAVGEVPENEWHPIYKEVKGKRIETGREWAEVCFVPNAIGRSKKGPVYRYLATREELRQMGLPGIEQQESLPFPEAEMEGRRYKVFGIVTNMMDLAGEELIRWHYKRCGKSEEAHSVMKEDLAGGKLPSGEFGENAAWWWIMCLALNINSIMKRLVLGGAWAAKRMKAIRYWIINLPGRVVERSRQLWVRLGRGHPAFELILEARRRIMALASSG